MPVIGQTSFSKGQISKNLLGQVDSPIYKGGCLSLKDATVGRYGTIHSRVGSEYVGDTLGGQKARLVPFKVPGSGDYIIEFTNEKVRVWTEDGTLVDLGSGVFELPSVYANDNLHSIQYAQSEDSLFLVDGSNKEQVLSLREGVWSYGEIVYDVPPTLQVGTQDITFTTELITPATATTMAVFKINSSAAFFKFSDNRTVFRIVDRWFLVTGIDSNNTVTAHQFFLNPNGGQSPGVAYAVATTDWDGPWVRSDFGPTFQNFNQTVHPLTLHDLFIEPDLVNYPNGFFNVDKDANTVVNKRLSGTGIIIDVDPNEGNSTSGPRMVYINKIENENKARVVPINTIDFQNTSSISAIYRLEAREGSSENVFTFQEVSALPGSNPPNFTSGVSVYSSDGFFSAGSVGEQFHILGGVAQIDHVVNEFHAYYFTIQDLDVKDPTLTIDLHNPYPTANYGGGITIDTGFPRSVGLHQDRLFFGGFDKFPNRLLSSKTGEHLDWTQSADDDAGVSVDVTSGSSNFIGWLQSTGAILAIGTDTGEYALTGSPLAPANLAIELQTSFGSKSIQVKHVGSGPVYVTRSGGELRQFLYSDQQNRYLSTELTFNNDQLFANDPAKEYSFVVEPNVMGLVVTEGGSVKSFSSRPEAGVEGWSEWSLGAYSVTSLQGATDDSFWLCVEREGGYVIERISSNQRFLDSWSKAESTDTIAGLERFNGLEVSVIIDGSVDGTQTVSNGTIPTLPTVVDEIVVGLSFAPEIQPIFQEYSDRVGDTVGRLKQISEVSIHADIGDGVKINGESVTPEGDGSGWWKVAALNINSPLPRISITQELPVAFTLYAVAARIKEQPKLGDV